MLDTNRALSVGDPVVLMRQVGAAGKSFRLVSFGTKVKEGFWSSSV